MSLSNTINTLLNKRIVRVAHLVELDFTPTKRLWNGSRALTTLDGNEWFGLRSLGSIEGFAESSDNMQAAELKLSITGVNSDLLSTAVSEDRAGYVGKIVRIWLQFFDEDWQCLDNPVAFKAGIIDGIEVSRSSSDEGPSVRVLTVTAQNIFYGRSLPSYAFYTARDQQLRSPGDRGLEYINELLEIVIPVPW